MRRRRRRKRKIYGRAGRDGGDLRRRTGGEAASIADDVFAEDVCDGAVVVCVAPDVDVFTRVDAPDYEAREAV